MRVDGREQNWGAGGGGSEGAGVGTLPALRNGIDRYLPTWKQITSVSVDLYLLWKSSGIFETTIDTCRVS